VLDRLLVLVAAVGPILALLAGIAMIAVGVAWVVTKVSGPRERG
jgi:hypothetical protein